MFFEQNLYAATAAAPAAAAAAPAATPAAPADPMAMLMQFLPLILIFVLFYFMFIVPQRKEQKKHQEMLNALKEGDKVVTSGGIVGVITKINDKDEVIKVTSAESTVFNVLRSNVSKKIEK